LDRRTSRKVGVGVAAALAVALPLVLLGCGEAAVPQASETGSPAGPAQGAGQFPEAAAAPVPAPADADSDDDRAAADPVAEAPDPIDVLDADGLPQVPPGSELAIDESFYKNGRRRYRRLVETTADGIRSHGAYVRWFKNGVVDEVGAFRHGLREGTFVTRYDSGQLRSEIEYHDGKIDGRKREWAEAGYLERDVYFADGLQQGPYRVTTSWYEGILVTVIEGQFDHGKKTGAWTYHYNTGERRDAGEFADDLREGRWTTWYKEGPLQREVDYLHDEWHGLVIDYDEQGRKLSEQAYEHGVANGPRTEWFPNGQLESRRNFVAGTPEGAMTTWYEDGTKESEGEMRGGKQEGPWTFWNADGSVNEAWTGSYADGERVE